MDNKHLISLPDQLYYTRLYGSGHKPLFNDKSEYEYFISLLASLHQNHQCQSLGFCLFAEEIHLVLKSGSSSIEKSIQSLTHEYTHWFNDHHKRHGSVFSDEQHCLLLEPANYLAPIIHFIHRLPLAAGLVPEAAIYPWSSHVLYLAESTPDWLDTDTLNNLIARRRGRPLRRYKHFIDAEKPYPWPALPIAADGAESWLTGNQTEVWALATTEFIQQLKATDDNPLSPERPMLDAILHWVCQAYGIKPSELNLRRNHRLRHEIHAAIAHLGEVIGQIEPESIAEQLGTPQEDLEGAKNELLARRELFITELEQRLQREINAELASAIPAPNVHTQQKPESSPQKSDTVQELVVVQKVTEASDLARKEQASK